MPPTNTGARAKSIRQAADRLGVHPNTVYRLIATGKLPSFHVGQQLRVDDDVLEAFVARGGSALATRTPEPDPIDAWVERTVATAPPLTDEQRTKLAELLRPVRKAGGARD
jgi:excisionase family DNA binding protein